jgi:excisionase family DNA binding protein
LDLPISGTGAIVAVTVTRIPSHQHLYIKTTTMPNAKLNAPQPADPATCDVDAFFADVVRNVHERLALRKQERIPSQPTFTIAETAALTGQDVDEISYWVRHGEIPSSNPTGMQRLIPREEVLKLMPCKTDDSATQESM